MNTGSANPAATHNQRLGSRGEAIAARYLEERGYRIIDRNWRTRHGELDLVVEDRGTLVAVEVKTRSGSGYGHPLEAITTRKAGRLKRLLLDWARVHDSHALGLRVDAVGITVHHDAAPRIDHLRGIL
ncbi:YraN family protein [Leucobacter sp. wl10]|uniref:YraN family protein n=1 Tax=Leucobacter sp. wl10 TaxID=2304677 RepID=UPI000E5A6A83|nr:YraN family protein [Leucobacter sp. wl10]RGE21541.1 YraN family protein [Leucobacter sp. wl10]